VLVAVDDDADVDANNHKAEDEWSDAEAEGQVSSAPGLTRSHLSGHSVSGRDGCTTLWRAQDGEDSHQPATANSHEDRVAHVVVRWIL